MPRPILMKRPDARESRPLIRRSFGRWRVAQACLAVMLLALASGCTSMDRSPAWQRIHEHVGSNACDAPLERSLPLTHFDVRHDEQMVVNVTLQLDAGLVEFQLLNPLGFVERSRQFSSSGADSFVVADPLEGEWEARIVCQSGVRFNLEWRITVDALPRA